jgi:hypothetical protein
VRRPRTSQRRAPHKLRMRDLEVIDSELRLLLAIRHMAREAEGRPPSTAHLDALLDERAAALASSKRLSRQYAKGRVKT